MGKAEDVAVEPLKQFGLVKFRSLNTVFLIAIPIALLVLFAGGLKNILDRWYIQAEYSHGYLVPLVTGYLLWERKAELFAYFGSAQFSNHIFACGLFFVAMVLLIVGEVSALYLLIHYALLLFLFAWSVVLLGRGAVVSFVPIAILAFAIPIPYFVEVILSAKLQLFSSRLGVEFIRMFNIPVYLSGNVIDLGEFKLHVVEACSGLRYLFPLACLGFLAAYFYQAKFWKRGLLFLSTIPITIVMNSARIGATGLLVENFGPESASGFLHDFEGWVVFLLCLAILLLELKLLELATSKRSLAEVFRRPGQSFSEVVMRKDYRRTGVFQGFFLAVLLVTIVGLHKIDTRQEQTVPSLSLAGFPMSLGQWHGSRDFLAHDIAEGLQLSDYMLANYRSAEVSSAEPLNLYIAYYESQRKGVSPHSPKVCIPGGGWEIAEFSRVLLNQLPVNRAIVRKGNKSQLVYYWFVERGEVVANEYWKKWLLFRDALLLNRSDGSLVRIVTPIDAAEGIAVAEARVAAFVQHAHPAVMRYLPSSVTTTNLKLSDY